MEAGLLDAATYEAMMLQNQRMYEAEVRRATGSSTSGTSGDEGASGSPAGGNTMLRNQQPQQQLVSGPAVASGADPDPDLDIERQPATPEQQQTAVTRDPGSDLDPGLDPDQQSALEMRAASNRKRARSRILRERLSKGLLTEAAFTAGHLESSAMYMHDVDAVRVAGLNSTPNMRALTLTIPNPKP